MKVTGLMLLAACAAPLFLALPRPGQASIIPMPAGSRSWMLVSSADCDDDGSGPDTGGCIGAVSSIDQLGDIGHNVFAGTFQILCNAQIDASGMHGYITTTPNHQFAFLDMSMIDTYTLHGGTVPDGTVVPITVVFHATATMLPINFFSTAYGGGDFEIHIGNSFSPDPVLSLEGGRVPSFGGAAQASFFTVTAPNGNPIPLDLTATHTFDATVGAPFDLGFYLGARPAAATIDFSHTAVISFALPDGMSVTSLGGFGSPTPVESQTWSKLKSRYYR